MYVPKLGQLVGIGVTVGVGVTVTATVLVILTISEDIVPANKTTTTKKELINYAPIHISQKKKKKSSVLLFNVCQRKLHEITFV